MKPGDEVLAVNGEKIYSPFAVDSAQEAMSNGVVKPLTLTSQRGGEKFDCTMLPVKPLQPTNAYPQLGITAWQGDTNTLYETTTQIVSPQSITSAASAMA